MDNDPHRQPFAVDQGVDFAALDLQVITAPFSAAMISEARRRSRSAEFRVGDAEQLQFDDGSFDAVVCPFGVLHLPEGFHGGVLRSPARRALWTDPSGALRIRPNFLDSR
jgi:hypothetical protein